jgi:hypothetical protein
MNKLLKFKDFNTLIESYSINESTPKWVIAAQTAYSTFNPSGRWVPPGTGEILRADLGELPEDFIERFLSANGIPDSDYEIDNGDYSGKFFSFELTFNKDHLFFGKDLKAGSSYGVVNAVGTTKEGGKVVIGDKDLIPSKLGLEEIIFETKIQLVTKANESIKSSVTNQDYQNFILDLVSSVETNTKSKFSTKEDLNGIKSEPVSLDFDYTPYKGKLDPASINNIQKDFGEVLGGIFMMGLVSEQNPIKFPGGNEELVDFFYNEIGISSKAKKGAKASATGYIKAIKRAKAETGGNYTDEERIIVDKILSPIELGYNEPKNTSYFTRSKSSTTFTGVVRLLNEFMLQENGSGWNYFINMTGINTTRGFNRDSIVDAFILLRDQKKLHEFVSGFVKLTDLSSGGGRDGKYLMPFYASRNEVQCQNSLKEILDNEQYDLLVGTILYGCSKQLQTKINSEHSSHLSALINNCLSSKQLYLDMKIKQNKIQFILAAMETSNFEIGTLNGIGSWDTKKISIYMTK